MSRRLRWLFGVGVISMVLAGGAPPAHAQEAPAADPSCAPADQAQITAVLSDDGHEATFTVGNALPLCDALPIGLAVYLKDADGFVVPQSLVDSATDTITSGQKVLSVTLPVDGTAPSCFTQVDAFTGAPLPEITETDQYGPRLLAYQWSEVANCGEVLAENTKSSTTTTLRTNDVQLPANVEGVQVTRTPTSVQARAQALPRTGPSADIGPLLAAAGLLMMLGGALLVWSNRPA